MVLLGGAVVARISCFASHHKHATINHVAQFTQRGPLGSPRRIAVFLATNTAFLVHNPQSKDLTGIEGYGIGTGCYLPIAKDDDEFVLLSELGVGQTQLAHL